jgi:hypothetical protein
MQGNCRHEEKEKGAGLSNVQKCLTASITIVPLHNVHISNCILFFPLSPATLSLSSATIKPASLYLNRASLFVPLNVSSIFFPLNAASLYFPLDPHPSSSPKPRNSQSASLFFPLNPASLFFPINPASLFFPLRPKPSNHRLNMELDLQSLFGLHVSCTCWQRPPPRAFGLVYEGAIGQPR